MADLEKLKKVSLFYGLSDQTLTDFKDYFKLLSFDSDHIIFKEDSEGATDGETLDAWAADMDKMYGEVYAGQVDPATAAKVLEISDDIVREEKLTCLMITHNMTDAINLGNRLIMMNEGTIVVDISGDEKKQLTKNDLLQKFADVAGVQEETDSVLLS